MSSIDEYLKYKKIQHVSKDIEHDIRYLFARLSGRFSDSEQFKFKQLFKEIINHPSFSNDVWDEQIIIECINSSIDYKHKALDFIIGLFTCCDEDDLAFFSMDWWYKQIQTGLDGFKETCKKHPANNHERTQIIYKNLRISVPNFLKETIDSQIFLNELTYE